MKFSEYWRVHPACFPKSIVLIARLWYLKNEPPIILSLKSQTEPRNHFIVGGRFVLQKSSEFPLLNIQVAFAQSDVFFSI